MKSKKYFSPLKGGEPDVLCPRVSISAVAVLNRCPWFFLLWTDLGRWRLDYCGTRCGPIPPTPLALVGSSSEQTAGEQAMSALPLR
ncbi:hypothetical protein BRADI_5g15871v3 [Brachypodium distachyon]|uniref:Uncharacterized protein n=1 Tax=Brachypodium distachyon TaxID=15368 RepID=A0A0Q3P4E5_BRADI|nr:hypothetical protein BRADI_5g15871v3 [Brachypodium distachyon]